MTLIARVGEVTHDDEVSNNDSVNIWAGMQIPFYNQNDEIERWGWIEEIIRGQSGGTQYVVRFVNQEFYMCDTALIQGK